MASEVGLFECGLPSTRVRRRSAWASIWLDRVQAAAGVVEVHLVVGVEPRVLRPAEVGERPVRVEVGVRSEECLLRGDDADWFVAHRPGRRHRHRAYAFGCGVDQWVMRAFFTRAIASATITIPSA